MKYNDLNNLCKKYRNEIFEKILLTQQGHPGSIFSMMEIAVVLYHGGYVRFDSNKKKFIDKVLVSKGHATSTLYPILKEFGVISKNDWENWGIAKSNLRINNYGLSEKDIISDIHSLE